MPSIKKALAGYLLFVSIVNTVWKDTIRVLIEILFNDMANGISDSRIGRKLIRRIILNGDSKSHGLLGKFRIVAKEIWRGEKIDQIANPILGLEPYCIGVVKVKGIRA